jgi:transcriptional regulator with XRE-family HTH domain
MTILPQSTTVVPNSFGDFLRHWRSKRGKSQLDLALDAGISQKHVSFVETGRSSPSRRMVIDLSEALGVPLRDRNEIMLAAGFAPVHDEKASGRLSPEVDRALQRMLRQHEPFPAIVLDRYWNVIATNDAAPKFFGKFVHLDSRPSPRNLLHLVFDPNGLRPFLEGFDEIARSLLWRVRREAVGGILDERSRQLVGELLSYGGDTGANSDGPNSDLPVIPVRFRVGENVISMFSLITTVGTPQTIAGEETRLESMFPSDAASEAAYLELMSAERDMSQ